MKKHLVIVLLSLVVLVFGCATTEDGNVSIDLDNDTAKILIEESIDTFGYSLGLMAAKDPQLKAEIETYYATIQAGEFTLTALNVLLQKYSSENVAYQVLIYKVSGLVKRVGGTVLDDGTITSLGDITQKHLDIGKNAYLLALKTSGVTIND